MPVSAKLRYLRIAPRKVRLVADLIRGKKVEEAQTILEFTQKRAAGPLLKLLKSAIANARHNFQLDPANLFISKITVDEGPKYKRWMPRARGMAYEIQKKTSHVTLILEEIEKRPKKIKKVRRVKVAPEKVEKVPKPEKPKLRPKKELIRPKIEKGIRRVFRRKAF
jgi:large subunit ribosomal protein L22